jgi:hypothetical protein
MRKDQHKVSIQIDGVKLGVFDIMTGGETDSDELKYKPGGMAPEISLGGTVTVGQVVASKIYLEADHNRIHWLLGRVGKGKAVVDKAILDIDGNKYGRSLVTRGVLKRVTPPEVDSTSTEAAMLELEITPQGVVT